MSELGNLLELPNLRMAVRSENEVDFAMGAAVPDIPQGKCCWCWAACVEMITTFFGRPVTQCRAAEIAFGGSCCQAAFGFCDSIDPCNKGLPNPQAVGAVYGAPEIDLPPRQVGPVSFSTIQDSIDHHKPVQIGIKWNKGFFSAHALVIAGYYDDNTRSVQVNDPLDSFGGKWAYDDLANAFGTNAGVWKWTWLWS